jgi:site-specific recombinase XerD
MGVNSKVVQERLGQSTISITLGVYGHVTESMQRDAMQKLDDASPAHHHKRGLIARSILRRCISTIF